jgi:hypothetical protein
MMRFLDTLDWLLPIRHMLVLGVVAGACEAAIKQMEGEMQAMRASDAGGHLWPF